MMSERVGILLRQRGADFLRKQALQFLDVYETPKLADKFLFLHYPKPFVEVVRKQWAEPCGEACEVVRRRPSAEVFEMLFEFFFGHSCFCALNSIERSLLLALSPEAAA
ncbi:MAG: hypothetical protein ABSB35_12385 [Bryobacteraceae bacterium]|jgi:hypothetical protein